MTMVNRKMVWPFMLLIAWILALAGCAALQTSQTEDTEQLLSAAGFHLKLANTPEKQAHLRTLMQHKLVPHERNGKVIYIFADAANNRLYVGDEPAYQKFQALAVQKQLAQEQATAAQYNAAAAMNWDMWGPYPFGPWMY